MLMLIENTVLRLFLLSRHFNTSHVNVNRCGCRRMTFKKQHFNTSHVNVNRTYQSVLRD